MILRIKKFISTDLIKVSFLNGLATIIKMLTSLVSVKVIAAVIGPAGIALLGQLNNFSAILLSISNGGINAGITKYLAEYSDSRNKYSLFLRSGFQITAGFSIITSLILIFGAGYFSELILHDRKYISVFYIFGFTIIFYALNALLISVLNGFKEYKRYVIANILGSLVGLAFSLILALNFGIFGALIAAVTFQSVVFLLTLFLIKNSKWFTMDAFIGKFSKTAAYKLGHYSLMALVTATVVPTSQLIVRGYITSKQSIIEAGVWEGMNRISGMYLLVLITSLSVYFLPRLSELKTKQELRKEIFSVYKLILPSLLITSLVIFSLRRFIIHILFTSQFAGMDRLFGFQLMGDIFKMSGWVLGYILLAKAMTKQYIIMEFVGSGIFVLLSIYFIRYYGALGATLGYALGQLTYLLILVLLFRKTLFPSK
jgi:O-antigen/teichoic acid export membrane protein